MNGKLTSVLVLLALIAINVTEGRCHHKRKRVCRPYYVRVRKVKCFYKKYDESPADIQETDQIGNLPEELSDILDENRNDYSDEEYDINEHV